MQRALALNSKVLPSAAPRSNGSLITTSILSQRPSATLPFSRIDSYSSRFFSSSSNVQRPPRPQSLEKLNGKPSPKRPGQKQQHYALGRWAKHKSPPRASLSRQTLPQQSKDSAGHELQAIASTLDLPTANDVPNFPAKGLRDPVVAMSATISKFDGYAERQSGSPGNCRLYLNITDDTGELIKVEGRGSTQKVARASAYLHLLARLHEKNLAVTAFPVSERVMQQEKHALLDVYLFAARYGEFPIKKIHDSTNRRKIKFIEVELQLPRLGISVTGRAKTTHAASIAAGLHMKAALAKLATESGEAKALPQDEVFGLKSATDFCQWYRYENRGITFEPDSKIGKGGTILSTKMVIKGSAMEEPREFHSVSGSSKKQAEELAALIAALTLCQENPELRSRFFREYKKNNSQILAPVSPLGLDVSRQTASAIQQAIRASRSATDQLEENKFDEVFASRDHRTMYQPLDEHKQKSKCQELKRRRDAYQAREDLAELRKTRSDYPMNQHTKDVLKTVGSNIYSIIIGQTGSGKTTQVPQILLNDAIERGEGASCNIICTQPRRIAAKSVAQRVADERAEFLGDCVGYHVKKDVCLPAYGGSINFCTTGILSQQLQFAADEIMDNCSHLIIDEVHERDTIIDFLLTSLKRIVKQRTAAGKRVPQIILMSATIDADLFSGYLSLESTQGELKKCPSLTVPGRTFPVKEFYLEDVMRELQKSGGQLTTMLRAKDTSEFIASERNFAKDNQISTATEDEEDAQSATIDWAAERQKATRKGHLSVEEQEQAMVPHSLAASTISHIAQTTNEGAILTFLPGLEDITKVDELLKEKQTNGTDFNDTSKFKIFMLHSSIQHTQKEVFDPVPAGCRKIILATNIAETSITIPDVQHVVDTGKLREKQYDQTRRITKLACVWVSKSNAKQRAGRAGRVQHGNFYALYTKERYHSLRAVGLPELLRSDLAEVCLEVKNQGYSIPVKQFLSEAIEPPPMESVDNALQNLVALQAIDEDESLTALGKLLAQLPVHPSLGKMIVMGIIFRCLDPMLIIGATFGERSLWVRPLDARKAADESKEKFARNTLSDHIGVLAAIKELRMLMEVRGPRAMGDYAIRNYLHMGAFRSILGTAETIEQLLVEQGVIPRTSKMKRAQFQFGDPSLNENSDKVGLIKALILAGFSPNLGIRRGRVQYRTPSEASTLVYPASVNAADLKGRHRNPALKSNPKTELLTYSELARSNDGNTLYLRETTPVTPLMAALFSSRLDSRSRNIVKMDDWLPFYLPDGPSAASILTLHKMLKRVMTAAFNDLASRRVLTEHQERNDFADALVEVLDSDLLHNNSKGEGHSTYSDRPDPTAAFAPGRRAGPGSRPAMKTQEERDRQATWENLMASWGRSNTKKTEDQDSQTRPSVASLFEDSPFRSRAENFR